MSGDYARSVEMFFIYQDLCMCCSYTNSFNSKKTVKNVGVDRRVILNDSGSR